MRLKVWYLRNPLFERMHRNFQPFLQECSNGVRLVRQPPRQRLELRHSRGIDPRRALVTQLPHARTDRLAYLQFAVAARAPFQRGGSAIALVLALDATAVRAKGCGEHLR